MFRGASGFRAQGLPSSVSVPADSCDRRTSKRRGDLAGTVDPRYSRCAQETFVSGWYGARRFVALRHPSRIGRPLCGSPKLQMSIHRRGTHHQVVVGITFGMHNRFNTGGSARPKTAAAGSVARSMRKGVIRRDGNRYTLTANQEELKASNLSRDRFRSYSPKWERNRKPR